MPHDDANPTADPAADRRPADRTAEGDDRAAVTASRSPLTGLGPAIRRLRMQRGLRQYEAAHAAGVTKAMLSAYETGKRRPSIRTLDSVLVALDASLGDLHLALVAGRRERALREAERGTAYGGRRADELAEPPVAYGDHDLAAGYPSWAPPAPLGWNQPSGTDLHRALGVRAPLSTREERAFAELLRGFLELLRSVHHGVDR